MISWMTPLASLDGLAAIDHLFNRMDGIYQHRWRSAFPAPDSVRNWREAWGSGLDDEGVTLGEVGRGLAECRRAYDWPPSFAEFLRACRPQPDPEAAYHEAVEQMRMRRTGEDAWSSPVVFWAAARMGCDLSSRPYAANKGRWLAALRDAAKGVRSGSLPSDIPPRRDALPATIDSGVSADVARRNLAEMRNRLVNGRS